MNDPSNLQLYSELVVFQADRSKTEIVFDSPDSPKQRVLHSLASGLDLEYEYSLVTRAVRITRIGRKTVGAEPSIEPFQNDSSLLSEQNRTNSILSDIDLDTHFPNWLNRQDPSDFGSYDLEEREGQHFNPTYPLLGPDPAFQQSDIDLLAEATSPLKHHLTQFQYLHNIPEPLQIPPLLRTSSEHIPEQRAPFRSSASPASSIKSTASSGRQGPLNSIVYTTMKAVKAVGACWRCKILRKSVGF